MASGASQAQMAALTPHVDLNATIGVGPANPVFSGDTIALPVRHATGPLFDDQPEPQKGWKALARLLEAATPKVDTSIPLTPSQITDRIQALIDQGDYQQALGIIEKRETQLADQGGIGTDVQLMFLHGRALAGLERHNEAIDVYRHMTTTYPELPEPWNNLASEYVKQGKLDMAREALNMALAADPNYATARANLGDVDLMLARREFEHAARLGVSDAAARAEETTRIIKR